MNSSNPDTQEAKAMNIKSLRKIMRPTRIAAALAILGAAAACDGNSSSLFVAGVLQTDDACNARASEFAGVASTLLKRKGTLDASLYPDLVQTYWAPLWVVNTSPDSTERSTEPVGINKGLTIDVNHISIKRADIEVEIADNTAPEIAALLRNFNPTTVNQLTVPNASADPSPTDPYSIALTEVLVHSDGTNVVWVPVVNEVQIRAISAIFATNTSVVGHRLNIAKLPTEIDMKYRIKLVGNSGSGRVVETEQFEWLITFCNGCYNGFPTLLDPTRVPELEEVFALGSIQNCPIGSVLSSQSAAETPICLPGQDALSANRMVFCPCANGKKEFDLPKEFTPLNPFQPGPRAQCKTSG